jgi:hypothetical protein
MPGLAQWFSCNVELAGVETTHLTRTPRGAESVDEIRVPRLDERGATDGSRDSLYMAIAAIALTAAIALAVILSLYIFRSTHSNRQTIEAIDVKALVERIIKVESTGIANKGTSFPAPQGLVNFLMTHGSKPSESIAAI